MTPTTSLTCTTAALTVTLVAQVSYLDPLIWVHTHWRPIGRAVRSTIGKDEALLKAYIGLAHATGRLSLMVRPYGRCCDMLKYAPVCDCACFASLVVFSRGCNTSETDLQALLDLCELYWRASGSPRVCQGSTLLTSSQCLLRRSAHVQKPLYMKDPNPHAMRMIGRCVYHRLHSLQVLSSRVAVPDAVLECYRPLFRGLSLNEIEKVLLPALLRVAKRLPEVMLPVMEAVFGMLDAELSSQSVFIAQELLPQLRHAKEAVRCVPTKHALMTTDQLYSCLFAECSMHITMPV